MTRRRWIRMPPEREDTVGAAALAVVAGVGVGVATWYVARLLLAREPVGAPPGTSSEARLPEPAPRLPARSGGA